MDVVEWLQSVIARGAPVDEVGLRAELEEMSNEEIELAMMIFMSWTQEAALTDALTEVVDLPPRSTPMVGE